MSSAFSPTVQLQKLKNVSRVCPTGCLHLSSPHIITPAQTKKKVVLSFCPTEGALFWKISLDSQTLTLPELGSVSRERLISASQCRLSSLEDTGFCLPWPLSSLDLFCLSSMGRFLCFSKVLALLSSFSPTCLQNLAEVSRKHQPCVGGPQLYISWLLGTAKSPLASLETHPPPPPTFPPTSPTPTPPPATQVLPQQMPPGKAGDFPRCLLEGSVFPELPTLSNPHCFHSTPALLYTKI